jgi:hypothetical protein
MIFHTAGQVADTATDAPVSGYTENLIWFEKPILSTGFIGAHMGGSDSDIGELGLIVFYDYVDVPDNELLQELVQLE